MNSPLAHILAAEEGGDTSSASWWSELLGSPEVQSAVIAALVAGLIGWLTNRAAKKQREQSDRQRELDFRRTQLNDLYGPLYMRRAASEHLRKLLPDKEANGDDWGLVDHIADVRGGNHPEWEAVVREIIEVGREVETLLVAKAGLHESFPPPESFKMFVAHFRMLEIYWE